MKRYNKYMNSYGRSVLFSFHLSFIKSTGLKILQSEVYLTDLGCAQTEMTKIREEKSKPYSCHKTVTKTCIYLQ